MDIQQTQMVAAVMQMIEMICGQPCTVASRLSGLKNFFLPALEAKKKVIRVEVAKRRICPPPASVWKNIVEEMDAVLLNLTSGVAVL